MFQNHNSIGQNNTEQNKGRQNNTWIGDSHSKMRQHRPFCSHHKSVFPTQGHPQAPQHKAPQHAPHPQNRHTHPALLASFLLSAFLLFSRHHFPCSWQADINTAISEKLNEKQTLWQQTHPLHTGIPTGHSNMHPNRTQACTTPSQASAPPFLHPSFFPLPPFLKAPLPMLLANKHQHSHFRKTQ